MPCLGDMGYKSGEQIRAAAVITAATMKQVAAAAIAIDNANQLIDNYRSQRDISQRGIDISREAQDQLSEVFWPREEQFLAEFSEPEVIETVEAMGRRYSGRLVADIAGAFAAQLREARCSFRRYCSSANSKLIQDLMLARANAMANARVLGRNIAFAEYQARHDINLSRRMQAVALGRGLINQAMSLYQAAGRGFAASGDTLSANFNSALESFGYAQQQRRGARDYLAQVEAMPAYETSAPARMPGTTSGWNGNPLPAMLPGFGMASSQRSMFDLEAGNVMKGDESGLSSGNDPSNFQWRQSEKMNDAEIGNNDLARTGTATFPVAGITGGSVTINMDAFPLRYVDHLTEFQPYGVG